VIPYLRRRYAEERDELAAELREPLHPADMSPYGLMKESGDVLFYKACELAVQRSHVDGKVVIDLHRVSNTMEAITTPFYQSAVLLREMHGKEGAVQILAEQNQLSLMAELERMFRILDRFGLVHLVKECEVSSDGKFGAWVDQCYEPDSGEQYFIAVPDRRKE